MDVKTLGVPKVMGGKSIGKKKKLDFDLVLWYTPGVVKV